MEAPDPNRTPDSDAEKPDFDQLEPPADLVRRGKTRDRVYTTVLQLNEPATVSEVADQADAGPDATREYLRWFADLGLIHQNSTDPEQYVLNRGYLQWRRANQLSQDYRESELVQHLQDVTEEIERYRDDFDATEPREIDVVAAAENRTESIEEIWQTVSAWETAEQRHETLRQALQMRRDTQTYYGQASEANANSQTGPDTAHQ